MRLHHALRAAAGDTVPITSNGLIAHWSMDNIGVSILVDETGVYDAALEGGWSQVAGVDGQALNFDGVDAAGRLGAVPIGDPLQLIGDFTVSFWAYFVNTGDSWQRIIDKSDGANGQNGWAIINNQPSSGDLDIIIDGTHHYWPITFSGFDHYCLVSYGASAELFQNNVSKGEIPIRARPNTQTNAAIGTWNHSTGRELNGSLDALRIYNRAITSTERTALYNQRSL